MYKSLLIKCYLLIELSKSFVINVRDKNKRTNLGNIYLDRIYTVTVITANANVTSFIK